MTEPEPQLTPESVLLCASSDLLQAWYRISISGHQRPGWSATPFEADIAAIRDTRLQENFPGLHQACRHLIQHITTHRGRCPPEIITAVTALDHAIANLSPP